MDPLYPVYIVSKGRWESRLTARSLDAMGVPYQVVVEAQEFDQYAAVLGPERLLVLDPAYQRDYDTFDDLGDSKSKGPGPARNFAWDHATAAGFARHWVMDDNIQGFYRLHQNSHIRVLDGAALRMMEDFTDRYTNIAMAGPQYFMFVPRKEPRPPFAKNTRIYSCNLIDNAAPYRWRGRYNEDTDLSLRMLKDGLCTVQFNVILQYKTPTQQLKGGNTDAFYAREGTLAKSQMLVRMHPDVSKLTWKYDRWHHEVNYLPFKANPLRRRPDLVVPTEPNNYGLVLAKRVEVE